MSSQIETIRVCEYCKNEFVAKTTTTRYCSHKCNSRAYKQRERELKIGKSISKTNQQKIFNASDLALEIIKQKEFLTIKDAYKLLGVSERTFYRLMKNGTILFTKLGSRTIIKRTEIDKLFSQ